jgi:hypothetical protein
MSRTWELFALTTPPSPKRKKTKKKNLAWKVEAPHGTQLEKTNSPLPHKTKKGGPFTP